MLKYFKYIFLKTREKCVKFREIRTVDEIYSTLYKCRTRVLEHKLRGGAGTRREAQSTLT